MMVRLKIGWFRSALMITLMVAGYESEPSTIPPQVVDRELFSNEFAHAVLHSIDRQLPQIVRAEIESRAADPDESIRR